MNKKYIVLTILAIVIITGIILVQSEKHVVEPNISSTDVSHVFTNGIYSFTYPTNWNAVKNKYNPESTLFGPSATEAMGEGGVEIQTSQKSLDTVFESNSEIELSNKKSIVVDGVPGFTSYVNVHGNGGNFYTAVFLKGDVAYHLYFRPDSNASDQLKSFNDLVLTFRIIK